MSKKHREVEKWLKSYRYIKSYRESLDRRISKYSLEIKRDDGINGIDYSLPKVSNSNISNMVENTVIYNITKLNMMKAEYDTYNELIIRIENAVNSLNHIEKRICKLYYLNDERLTWRQVARITDYSEKHLKNYMRNNILENLSIALFGIEGIISGK